ncbi:HAD-IA family hydrolase [Lentzea sp. NPDC006480]|uniref:HAD-IA family hydrolase n=1 Tax=Lentzea sp. NPDC006480 TaxID=3157176 RepID=UPI0033A2063A
MRGLIIDFGGVLSTPFEDSAKAFCKREGIEPNALTNALKANAELVADLERGSTTQEHFSEVIGLRLRLFPDDLVERITRQMQLRQEVVTAVRNTRAKVAVLTNSLGSTPFDLYERFDLDVDALIASDRYQMRKPDPKLYEIAADSIGTAPEDCVYVDDSPKFLEPASALGMTTVLATSPEVTIKALAELF